MQLDLELNRLAQAADPLSGGKRWFASLDEADQRAAIRRLVGFALQAGMTLDDGAASVEGAGLKPTNNAARLITAGGSQRVSLAKLGGLRSEELSGAFDLLLLAYAKADLRRRINVCRGSCTHWWHHLDDDGSESL